MDCRDCLDPQVPLALKVLLEIMASMVSLVSRVQEGLQAMTEMLGKWDCKVLLVQEECRERKESVVYWVNEDHQDLLDPLERAWDSTWLPCKQC